MSLVVLQEVSIGYRGPLLLDAVDCRIDAKQRIGLLGRNGAGKTTLAQGLARGLGVPEDHYVNSPTFAILQSQASYSASA